MTNEELLNFENRTQLFQFLVDDYGMKVIDEKYYKDFFGNFYIDLTGPDFSLRYNVDRSFLTIQIQSHFPLSDWYALYFIKNLLYTGEVTSDTVTTDNLARLNELNDFLKKDYDRIANLFSKENSAKTLKTLDKKLRERFK